jgi:hypothetical protein
MHDSANIHQSTFTEEAMPGLRRGAMSLGCRKFRFVYYCGRGRLGHLETELSCGGLFKHCIYKGISCINTLFLHSYLYRLGL